MRKKRYIALSLLGILTIPVFTVPGIVHASELTDDEYIYEVDTDDYIDNTTNDDSADINDDDYLIEYYPDSDLEEYVDSDDWVTYKEDYGVDLISESADYYYSDYGSYGLEDGASLYSKDEIKEIETKLKELSEYSNAYVITCYSGDAEITAKAKANQYTDAVVFCVDMENRTIYIYSVGDIYNRVNEKKAEQITDNTYMYFKEQRYGQGTIEAISQITTVASGKIVFSPMKMFCNLFVSISIGFMLAYLWLTYVLNKYSGKTIVKRKIAVNQQVSGVELDFENKNRVIGAEDLEDNSIEYEDNSNIKFAFVKKVHNSSSSSGGGHGGGGHGGGGGGHGF